MTNRYLIHAMLGDIHLGPTFTANTLEDAEDLAQLCYNDCIEEATALSQEGKGTAYFAVIVDLTDGKPAYAVANVNGEFATVNVRTN